MNNTFNASFAWCSDAGEHGFANINVFRHGLSSPEWVAETCEDAAQYISDNVSREGAVTAALLSWQPYEQPSFQERVRPWLIECFGETIAGDREERNHRFLEESLELVQSLGCTQAEAHLLVNYVFGRPVGHPPQEVGGVMVTLAALCLANKLDMHAFAECELERVWGKVEQIRAKQKAKPKFGPLPIAPSNEELA